MVIFLQSLGDPACFRQTFKIPQMWVSHNKEKNYVINIDMKQTTYNCICRKILKTFFLHSIEHISSFWMNLFFLWPMHPSLAFKCIVGNKMWLWGDIKLKSQSTVIWSIKKVELPLCCFAFLFDSLWLIVLVWLRIFMTRLPWV